MFTTHPDLVGNLFHRKHNKPREIPGASIATIDNAAHLPSLEHPAEFNRLLRDFLTSSR